MIAKSYETEIWQDFSNDSNSKGSRNVYLSANNFQKISPMLDFRGSDAFIGYCKQFKKVQLDSLGKA